MSVQDLKKELFKDKSFREYFEQNKRSYEIAVSIMKARISKRLSQEELAKKIGTKQPSIARLEGGSYLPSLRFLKKIEEALGVELFFTKPLKNESKSPTTEIKNFLYTPFHPLPTTDSLINHVSDASEKKYKF